MAYQKSLFADADIDPAVIYWVVIQCPVRTCRCADCPVTHTLGKTRWHKCRKCKFCFKSVQADLIPPVASDN